MNQMNNYSTNNIFKGDFRQSVFLRLKTAVVGWHSRRVAVRQLRAMPDSLLKDIGIERHQITATVNNFRAKPIALKNTAAQSAPTEIKQAA